MGLNASKTLSQLIKEQASLLGFTGCGIAKVRNLKEHEANYKTWIEKGFHADMSYLKRNDDKRFNPELLVENAKSIVSFAFNYFPNEKLDSSHIQIAKYAYGEDYHIVLKNKLHQLLSLLQKNDASISGRAFVDSAPVLERAWAVESGMGWIGKNGLLQLPQQGSYFFLCELVLNIELEYDKPFTKSFCGKCTKCIEACPSKAIIEPGVIDSRKCISYLTIEKKDSVTHNEIKNSKYIFGCDVCQDVCPWNRFAKPQKEFVLTPELQALLKNDFEQMTNVSFSSLFKNSSLQRAGFTKLKSIIDALKSD